MGVICSILVMETIFSNLKKHYANFRVINQKMKHICLEKNSSLRETVKRMSRAKGKGSNLTKESQQLFKKYGRLCTRRFRV